MKQLLILSLLAASAIIALPSCKKDPCKAVTCQNGGACIEGTCDCIFPYEGAFCEVRMTAKFVGQFAGNIVCFGQSDPESFIVTESQTEIKRIIISDGTESFHADLTSTTTFDIPSQTFDAGGMPATLTGNGSLSGNTLSMTLTVTVSGFPVTCTFSGTRQ
jgi:hypothetical protein